MTEHTRGPWFLINDHCVGGPIEPGWEEAGCGIAHCGMRARTQEEAKANAAYIVQACNAYPKLVEALEIARSYVETCVEDGWDAGEGDLTIIDEALSMTKPPAPTSDDRITIDFDVEEDGRHIAEIPTVPGALAYGSTQLEAAINALKLALAEEVEWPTTKATGSL